MNIYAGNLSYSVTEQDLQAAFETFGKVETVKVIKDKFSGESRGFGFVEMPSNEEAKAAIDGLGGTALKGKSITVNEARPKSNSRSFDHRGGRGGRSGERHHGQGGGGGGRSYNSNRPKNW